MNLEEPEPSKAIEQLLLKKYGDAERALEEVKEAEKRLKEIKGEHIK